MTRRRSNRGFTLIELVVTMLVLAVIAGAVAPRLLPDPARRLVSKAGQVADVLSSAARRARWSAGPCAIGFDAGVLRVLERRIDPRTRAASWTPDPLIVPLELDAQELSEVLAGTQRLSTTRFRIDLSDQVPAISILLSDAARSVAFRVDLAQDAADASVRDALPGEPLTPPDPAGIDLDALGRGEEPW